jgi:hypothetical protein
MSASKQQTTRGYLLLSGVLLTLIGIIGLVYSSYPLGTKKGSNMVGGPGELLQIERPKSVRVSDSGIIRVDYIFAVPPDDSSGQFVVPVVYQDITVTLHTASFDTAPASGQPIAKHIKNEVPHEWIWVIKPKQEGQQFVVLQFIGMPGSVLAEVASSLDVDRLPENSAVMNTLKWPSDEVYRLTKNPEFALNLVIPITVADVLGLTAIQARVVSIAAMFLGPTLTMPWLYAQWQKRRSENERKQQSRKQKRGPGSKRKRQSHTT